MKKIFLIIPLVLLLFLPSCSGKSEEYLYEPVTGELEKGTEEWTKISEMLNMLILDSYELAEIDSVKDASDFYRDSVLNYILGSNYAKFSGNSSYIEKINEDYPTLSVKEAIPASIFEYEMYRIFGGESKIVHKSGKLFRYLEESEMYVPLVGPVEASVSTELLRAQVTEHTYRIEFSCTADGVGGNYFAVIIKREDTSCYFDSILQEHKG